MQVSVSGRVEFVFSESDGGVLSPGLVVVVPAEPGPDPTGTLQVLAALGAASHHSSCLQEGFYKKIYRMFSDPFLPIAFPNISILIQFK